MFHGVSVIGVLDSALKWAINAKAMCIDRLQDVEAVMSHLAAIKVGIILEKAKVACALLLVSVAPSKGQGYQGICHLLRHPTKYAEHGIQCCQVYVARRLTHTSNLPQGRGLRQVWQRLWRAARCASAWVHEHKHSVFVLLGMDLVCESIKLPMATRAPGRRRAMGAK